MKWRAHDDDRIRFFASCPSRGTWIEMLMSRRPGIGGDGRAPRGARGLKSMKESLSGTADSSRAPRGARGLKFLFSAVGKDTLESCPSRGTWIEMTSCARQLRRRPSCPSRGTWIEICRAGCRAGATQGRAPRGARGLKFLPYELLHLAGASCPSRGTWIEIPFFWGLFAPSSSCPSRGTWIEMAPVWRSVPVSVVVPLAGHVD